MSDETTEEYLACGGKIEKLDMGGQLKNKPVGSVTKKQVNIMTLAEGELYFAEKSIRSKKVKVTDYSDINFDLIPTHLRELMKLGKEESGE